MIAAAPRSLATLQRSTAGRGQVLLNLAFPSTVRGPPAVMAGTVCSNCHCYSPARSKPPAQSPPRCQLPAFPPHAVVVSCWLSGDSALSARAQLLGSERNWPTAFRAALMQRGAPGLETQVAARSSRQRWRADMMLASSAGRWLWGLPTRLPPLPLLPLQLLPADDGTAGCWPAGALWT